MPTTLTILESILIITIQSSLYWVIYYQADQKKFDVLAYLISLCIFGFLNLSLNQVSALAYPIFFYGYLRCRTYRKRNDLAYFYSVYVTFIGLLLSNLISMLSFELIPLRFYQNHIIILKIIALLVPIVIHFFIIHGFKIKLDVLEKDDVFVKREIIRPLNYLLTICLIFFFVAYYYEVYAARLQASAPISEYTKYIMFIYVFMLITVIAFISNKTKTYLHLQLERVKDQQYEQLTHYTHEIEGMYQTLRGFRHDYQNMLISLQDSIDTGDLKQVQQAYQDVLVAANVKLTNNVTNINELVNIQNNTLKSVLFWELTKAKKAGIATTIEIKEEIPADLSLDLLDLVRLLSILLDNAIEAALETEQPTLRLAMIADQKQMTLIIQNSCVADQLSLKQIFEVGYSTKGPNRGQGLANAMKIIDANRCVTLETSLRQRQFTQQVMMGRELK